MCRSDSLEGRTSSEGGNNEGTSSCSDIDDDVDSGGANSDSSETDSHETRHDHGAQRQPNKRAKQNGPDCQHAHSAAASALLWSRVNGGGTVSYAGSR